MARVARAARFRLAATAALTVVLGASAAQAQPAADDRALAQALRSAEAGDFDPAIRDLSALAAETDASRIRLELGRVYFLAGEYRRAKEQFLKVYERDIPYPVRRTVNLYLDDIDQQIGYLRPRLGVVVDDNPLQQPPSGIYQVLGIPLSFERQRQTAYGAAYTLDGLAPLVHHGRSTLQLVGGLDGVTYPGISQADRTSANAGLRYDAPASATRITLGWRGYETASLRSSAPTIEYFRRWLPSRDRQLVFQASVEIDRFPGRPDLDGETARSSVSFVRDLNPSTSGQLAIGGSASSISDVVIPQREVFVRAAIARSLSSRKLDLVAALTASDARYGLFDPFFGHTREDRGVRAELSTYLARPTMGFFPGVVVSFEHRWSNIDFYRYQRVGMSLDFRRRF